LHDVEMWFRNVINIILTITVTLLLALAVIGFIRRHVPFAAMLAAYIVLRCLLLATMENAEPRYTLEAFPIVLIAAAMAIAPHPKQVSEPASG